MNAANFITSFHFYNEINYIFVDRRSSGWFSKPDDFESSHYPAMGTKYEKKGIGSNKVIPDISDKLCQNPATVAETPSYFCSQTRHKGYLA